MCAGCGRQNPDEFGFCPACGAPQGGARRVVRKVATMLFCDLVGSTELGERSEPEALHTLLRHYYADARQILARHGGTVEKFIGDAVVAVFGVPVAREDDAARAVRAAVELRAATHRLGLECRIGVNTGDVVVGAAEEGATGDAVNVAARLEQLAGAGQVYLGRTTVALVPGLVEVSPLELDAKGKSAPVVAYRLESLNPTPAATARRHDRALVGRKRERDRLWQDFQDVVDDRTCRLFTLVGAPGVGKSRLVADFVERVGDIAVVASGRALSYGEGITYWPLVEIVRQLGVEADALVSATPGETQRATRLLLERLATERPMVIVVEDLQWAEKPMVDLLEYVVDTIRDAPVLVVCVARPELVDVHAGWGGGRLNATSMVLQPLDDADAAEVVDDLLTGATLPEETRAQIVGMAEGNPLFLEELAALVLETGAAEEMPHTIRALLQARLDALDPAARRVLEVAAVEGQVFHRGPLVALSGERELTAIIATLERKDLIRPALAVIDGEVGFQFRHLLIRDAAYDTLSKAERSDLHGRYAAWLRDRGYPNGAEFAGHHLASAADLLAELGGSAAPVVVLRGEAGRLFGRAGAEAARRGDAPTCAKLLGRAVHLLPTEEANRVLPLLVQALVEQNLDPHEPVVLVDRLALGGPVERALAVVLRIVWSLPGMGADPLEELDDAERALADAGQGWTRALCEFARYNVFFFMARMRDAYASALRAYDLARADGDLPLCRQLGSEIATAGRWSGVPVREYVAALDQVVADLGGSAAVAARIRVELARARYLAANLDAEEFSSLVRQESDVLDQVGQPLPAVHVGFQARQVLAAVADDLPALAGALREYAEALVGTTREVYRVHVLTRLVLVLAQLGRTAEARALLEQARGLALPDDLGDQLELELGEAMVLALEGRTRRAADLLAAHSTRRARLGHGDDLALYVTSTASAWEALGDLPRAREVLAVATARHDELGATRVAGVLRGRLDTLGDDGTVATSP